MAVSRAARNQSAPRLTDTDAIVPVDNIYLLATTRPGVELSFKALCCQK